MYCNEQLAENKRESHIGMATNTVEYLVGALTLLSPY